MVVTSLIAAGPLTTQWTPPASCLSTTSQYNFDYFLGYQRYLGTDSTCFPPLLSPANGIATPTLVSNWLIDGTALPSRNPSRASLLYPNGTPKPADPAREALYFSPGICPSGYAYAASFTEGPRLRTSLTEGWKARSSRSIDESRYLCCPDGFGPESTSSSAFSTGYYRVDTHTTRTQTVTSLTSYLYPLCFSKATKLTNVYSVDSEWPKSKPTSPSLTEAAPTSSGVSVKATASGIVVGWKASDSVVVDFIASNNIELPTIPSSVSTSTSVIGYQDLHSGLSHGTKTAIYATVISFSAITVILCFTCRYASKHRKRPTPITWLTHPGHRMTREATPDEGQQFTTITSSSQPRSVPFEEPPPSYPDAIKEGAMPVEVGVPPAAYQPGLHTQTESGAASRYVDRVPNA